MTSRFWRYDVAHTGAVPAEKCITQALQHSLHRRLSSSAVRQILQCLPHRCLTLSTSRQPRLSALHQLLGVECTGPVLEMSAAPAPVVERVRQLQWVFLGFCATVEFIRRNDFVLSSTLEEPIPAHQFNMKHVCLNSKRLTGTANSYVIDGGGIGVCDSSCVAFPVEFVPLATATTTFSHRQVSVSWSFRRRGASLLLPSPMPTVPRQPWMSCSGLSLLTMEILSLQRFQIALVRQPVAGDPYELGKLGGFESVLEKSGCDPHAVFNLCADAVSSACGPRHTDANMHSSSLAPRRRRTTYLCAVRVVVDCSTCDRTHD